MRDCLPFSLALFSFTSEFKCVIFLRIVILFLWMEMKAFNLFPETVDAKSIGKS